MVLRIIIATIVKTFCRFHEMLERRFRTTKLKNRQISSSGCMKRYHEEIVGCQDSGVCMTANTTFRSKKGDKNPKTVLTKWYGVVNQILELYYGQFTEVVFYCDWSKAGSGSKICTDSDLVLVNLKRMRDSDNWRDEPAILAEEASGVFYSKDLKNVDWWVVIHSPQKMMRGIDNLEKPEVVSFQQLLLDEPNLRPLLRPLTNYQNLQSL